MVSCDMPESLEKHELCALRVLPSGQYKVLWQPVGAVWLLQLQHLVHSLVTSFTLQPATQVFRWFKVRPVAPFWHLDDMQHLVLEFVWCTQ
jgi:hypothetical protein